VVLCQAAWIIPAPHLAQGRATALAYGPGDSAPAAAASLVHNRAIEPLHVVRQYAKHNELEQHVWRAFVP
jgi:hypothetical protein